MTYRNPLLHYPVRYELLLSLNDAKHQFHAAERSVTFDYIMDLHRTLNDVQRMLTDAQIERDRLRLENAFLTRQLQENAE